MSPKGVTFVRCALAGTTSLAVRSVALWCCGTPIGLVRSLLKAFLLPLFFLSLPLLVVAF